MKYIKTFDNHTSYKKDSSTYSKLSLCKQEQEIHINSLSDLLNGHDYVDLGLPSGTLWATMNVGANSENDQGTLYMFMDSSQDIIKSEWQGAWHIPTRQQMQELVDNTTYSWVTNYKNSGVSGGTFTSSNGKVLFIPSTYLWSSTSAEGPISSYVLFLQENEVNVMTDDTDSKHPVHAVIG